MLQGRSQARNTKNGGPNSCETQKSNRKWSRTQPAGRSVPTPAAALAAGIGKRGLVLAAFTRAQQPFAELSRKPRPAKDRSAEAFRLEMECINVSLFARRQKDSFDQMPRSPIPTNANTARESVLGTSPQAQNQNASWRQVFKPCAFGIAGLAVAVFLWGYGYKLSLYLCRSESSSRVPVAKLWIGPRTASVAAASSLTASSHFVAGSQTAVAIVPQLPSMCRAFACILPLCERHAVLFDLLVPSRASPLLRLRPA